jgi:hypothetical protein
MKRIRDQIKKDGAEAHERLEKIKKDDAENDT